MHERVKDLTLEKEELRNNLDVVNKQTLTLEKGQIYQNDVFDRLEKEKVKLEIMNVELSEKLQKAELDLMNLTREKEEAVVGMAKLQAQVDSLKKKETVNLNKIIELKNDLMGTKKTLKERETYLKEEVVKLEENVAGLEKRLKKVGKVREDLKQLKRFPERIEERMKKVHLYGMKLKT